MEAPLCRLCESRHWGGCALVPVSKGPRGDAKKAWLDAHPKRTQTWLQARLADGFEIHHLDGDHENDASGNLVLIEEQDHRSLHGWRVRRIVGPSQAKFNRNAYQRKYMKEWRAKRAEAKARKVGRNRSADVPR